MDDNWWQSIRAPMQLNAALSVVVGAVLVLAPNTVDALLALDRSAWLRGFGVILLVHAVALLWAAQHANRQRWAVLNLVAIAPYPLVLMVLASSIITSPEGRTVLLVDGLAVGAVALWHAVALRKNRTLRAIAR